MRVYVYAEVQPSEILRGLRGADAPPQRGRAPAEKILETYAFRAVKALVFQGFPGMVGGVYECFILSPS